MVALFDNHICIEDIFFLVDGVFFEAHRSEFEHESEVFRDMFHLPTPVDGVIDGTSREHPLRLDGVKKNDFVSLLKVMFSRNCDKEEVLTTDEWISVLKLSTMWDFDRIRNIAIHKLTDIVRDPLQKVALAQRYWVDEWIISALNTLAQRESSVGVDDVAQLGLDWALKLARVRESFGTDPERVFCNCRCVECSYCDFRKSYPPSRSDYDFTDSIRAVFEL
ncbi:hypothetical protein AcV5_005519 [Taiwanofungus camphoratus]|nr:hypothetical protein AcV5_005519 [Antrodia cinnamomea]